MENIIDEVNSPEEEKGNDFLNKSEIDIIKEINLLFEKADTLFSKLSNEAQEKILYYHNENYSLNHCIRWGLTATEELIKEYYKR